MTRHTMAPCRHRAGIKRAFRFVASIQVASRPSKARKREIGLFSPDPFSMPAYNFQERFVPFILSGAKTHTIRRPRLRPTKRGDRLYLFTRMRQCRCRLILDTECTGVLPVFITEVHLQLAHKRLSEPDADRFARADGFVDYAAMKAFFRKQYGLPFRAEAISWRPPSQTN